MDSILKWFTGGDSFAYNTLLQGMAGDTLWIFIIMVLILGVVVANAIIAYDWFSKSRLIQSEEFKEAIISMKLLTAMFGIVAITTLVFAVLFIIWPGYRIITIALVVLNVISYWYIFKQRTTLIAESMIMTERKLMEQSAEIKSLRDYLKEGDKFKDGNGADN